MSADLQWLLVRNNSSFLRTSNGNILTSEPHNLMNTNSFKYSFVNNKTVGVEKTEGGIVLTHKVTKNKNKPASSQRKTILKRGSRRALKSISNDVAANHYRPDLKSAALKRASAILAAEKRR